MLSPCSDWAKSALSLLIVLLLALLTDLSAAQQGSTCSKLVPCKVGCCSSAGNCGYGPEFCGDECQSTCDATAECGQYAKAGRYDCPLNVCCSKHGFCGFNDEFCNSDCQNKDKNQCKPVNRPSCDAKGDAMSSEVRIGYYGAWSADRPCDKMEPENIPAGVLTHINVAFEYVSADHEITDEVGHIAGRASRLKNIYSGLRVNIAIGGWTFNDPPTATRFSDMASTQPNRLRFIESLVRYIQKYSLDGVDLDWEYPVASDRGGVPADYKNLVLLAADIREAFDSYDPGWQLTLTLPASYWYLKNFDIKSLQKYVDWFNVMTYDIHGVWDQHNIWTGPYLKGHTNITEIEDGLDLLWRNGIYSKKVVMGYGFYGRGFTMQSVRCSTPPNCKFSGPAFAGDCTDEPGILSYSEVMSKKGELGAMVKYDEKSSVKWMTYGSNQWISFDDAESFQAKLRYQFSRCLKGLMIWDLGLDTTNYDALIGLFGQEAVSAGLQDSSLNPDEENQLAFDLSAYTGQNCYIPIKCTDGKTNEPDAMCLAGFSSVTVGHAVKSRRKNWAYASGCSKGEYHHICCPTKALPKNCEWVGTPELESPVCNGSCGKSQFELGLDYSQDPYGNAVCIFGQRSLCCDSTPILQKCHWTDCDWSDGENGNCADKEVSVAIRFDKDDSTLCKVQIGGGHGGPEGPSTHQHFRSFCCPKDDSFKKCSWANDPDYFMRRWETSGWACNSEESCRKLGICKSQFCFEGKLAVTQAGVTPPNLELAKTDSLCIVGDYGSHDVGTPLCCSPPSRLTKDWPVDPAYLWSGAHIDKDDDVTWQWSDNFGNNYRDEEPNNLEADPGDDPYGFVMLDGPPGSIAKDFNKHFTFVTAVEPRHIIPRSFVTINQSVIDATFDHKEEEYMVYCNFKHNSSQCGEIFHKGAIDTIIKLPHHIGEGPYARVVAMDPIPKPPTLPAWTIRKRDATSIHRNGLYKLKFDYNFSAIQRDDDEEVFMRVDYTNLKDYWDDMTDEPTRRQKRSASDRMDYHTWRKRVDKAKNASYADNHNESFITTSGGANFSPSTKGFAHVERRWFGSFTNWLKKLNTITQSDNGFLPMNLSKMFNIYSGRLQCVNPSGVTFNAGLDITADIRMEMAARYAYYFSGTVVPPKIIDTYVFLGAQPGFYAGIDIRGNAELGYESERKKLVSTITYPGLSIKGIATVGPSLDLWGQLAGKITVAGQMKVGARYDMDPIEMYMPNDDETQQKASSKLKDVATDKRGISPVFQAGVKATVGLELRMTPEINCGIKIGGEVGPLKQPLVQAQVAVYANTSLYFEAHATADTDGRTSDWEYGYKIEFRWRVGMDAVASLYLYGSWKSNEFEAVPWQTIPIYGPITIKSSPNIGTQDSHSMSSRDGILPWELPENPLPNPMFGKLNLAKLYTTASAGEDYTMLSPPLANITARRPNTTSVVMSFIHRRGDDEENEFMLGNFKCTSGDTPCSIALGEPSKVNREASGRLFDFHDESGRDGTVVHAISPVEVSALRSRASTAPALDCPVTLPQLFYNCVGMFADSTLMGPNGNTITVPGICTSVETYLRAQGNNGNELPLHFDPIYEFDRRRESCGKSVNPCGDTDKRYKTTLGITGSSHLVTCDECPPASMEEGGLNWFRFSLPGSKGLHPDNPLGTTRTCAPTWQQSAQGNCHGILNNVQTDVEYFNNADKPNPGHPAWVKWDATGWNRANQFTGGGDPGRQRLTRYPNKRPYLRHGENIDDDHIDWFHKRNFTLHLVKPTETNDPKDKVNKVYGPVTLSSGNMIEKGGASIEKAVWIVCAVSLRGQARYRFDGNYNGYCWDGSTKTLASAKLGLSWMRLEYRRCRIDFEGAKFVSSKDAKSAAQIGSFHDEAVYGVELVGDQPAVEVDVPLSAVPLPDSRTSFPVS